jgi:hypothetical protein
VTRDAPRITDSAIAQLRARIGIAEPHPVPPHYTCPGEDAFRHVAFAYGDDNPLYCDPRYAATTPSTAGASTSGGRRSTRAVGSAATRVGVGDKTSEFAGRAVHEWTAQVFREAEGPLLTGQCRLMIRTEREQARERAHAEAFSFEPDSREAIEEIEALYRSEQVRGATPRYFEDVAEGDLLGPIAKGPLTVTDIICWHVGVGMGLYGVKPLRLGSWDPEYAKKAGNPTTYDYGRMREAWLVHSADHREAVRATLERRDPKFTGS